MYNIMSAEYKCKLDSILFSLRNRKFLITGASGGIGRSLVETFHKAGAKLCISGTKVEALEEISLKKDIKILPCNLAEKDKVKSLIKDSVEIMGGLDGLICNAGITSDKSFLRMDEKNWNRVIDVNLTATFILNRDACKYMLRNQWGRIVNIASVVGIIGNAGQSNYAASKAGIMAMSKSIAKEVASKNITVNCIAPGFINTAMISNLTELQKESIVNNIPMKRMGNSEEISIAALFLASEESSYITGSTLHVNGGLFMN